MRAVPWFWSDIGDMKLQMVGLTAGSDRQLVTGEPEDNRFSVFHYRAGRLAGIEIGQPAGRPHARPQDDGRRLFAGRGLAAGGGEALKAAFAAWQQGAA